MYFAIICAVFTVAVLVLSLREYGSMRIGFSFDLGLGIDRRRKLSSIGQKSGRDEPGDQSDSSDDHGDEDVDNDSPDDETDTDDEPAEDFIDIEGEKLSVALAPIVLDVSSCTNIDIIDAVRRRDAAVFVTPTSEDANALVELFIVAMPAMAEKFARGGVWSGADRPYGVDAIIGLDKCDNCGGYHYDVKVTVLVPFAKVRDLTDNVHRFFYPDGIKDIVDV